MRNIRNLGFVFVLIAFMGWCMYFYLQEISSKLLVHIHDYTFTVLEMMLAAMGAFYILILLIMLVVYFFLTLVKKIKA